MTSFAIHEVFVQDAPLTSGEPSNERSLDQSRKSRVGPDHVSLT